MGRKPKNARSNHTARVSFSELCRRAGLSPKERIIMRRLILKRMKQN
jgi:hypothetical protein